MPYKDRAKRLAYLREWRKRNPDAHRNWVAENREHRKQYLKKYCKEWRARNPGYSTEYTLRRRAENIQYRLAGNLRTRFTAALKANSKAGSAVRDLGCSVDEFKLYIENQFDDGVTWDNYGKIWELDHIQPLRDFDLTDRSQVLEACNWLNLRPMLIEENRGRCNVS